MLTCAKIDGNQETAIGRSADEKGKFNIFFTKKLNE